MNTPKNQCQYIGHTGIQCQDTTSDGQYCFWHNPTIDKKQLNLKDKLEARAKTGQEMDGFQLKGANLDNVDLTNQIGAPTALTNSNLSRASLQKAHFYNVDLSGCNLLKSNLREANLHRTNLANCNLLGTQLKSTKIEHANMGNQLLQEKQAYEAIREGRIGQAIEYFQEATEVIRNIRKTYEAQGLFSMAGNYFYREMVCHRKCFPKLSRYRIISKIVDMLSGYGEKPGRVILFSIAFIFFCSFFYFSFGVLDNNTVVQYSLTSSPSVNLSNWLETLYFSVVTFTTLGYGDLTPVGLSRLFAAVEAFTGSFTLALFVVVFVKKMTR